MCVKLTMPRRFATASALAASAVAPLLRASRSRRRCRQWSVVVAVAISPRNTGTPHFHRRTLPISSIRIFARLYCKPPRATERTMDDRRDLGPSCAWILLSMRKVSERFCSCIQRLARIAAIPPQRHHCDSTTHYVRRDGSSRASGIRSC